MRVQRDAGGGGVGDDRDQLITLQRSLNANLRKAELGVRRLAELFTTARRRRCCAQLLAAARAGRASNSFKKDAFSFKFSFCAEHEPSDCHCCCG